MGSSPSSVDKSPSAKQNQSESSSSSCPGTKSSKYKERSVYCFGMLCTSARDLSLFEGKYVSEMIVCKRGYADHWFVALKVKSDNNQSELFALHYCNIGTVLINEFKEEEGLTKTIYCPTRPTDLKEIVLQCLMIVQENSYDYLNHNCQTFVTKIMERFTDRKVNRFYSQLKIPIKGNLSKPLTSSYKGSQLEKEFLERFENKSMAVALSELEQENDHIESIIRNLCGLLISPQKELEHFKEKTLDQTYDKGLINKLKDLEKKQKNSDRSKIISQFARSTNLANTIWAIYAAAQNDSANEELLTPAEALEREIIENRRFLM